VHAVQPAHVATGRTSELLTTIKDGVSAQDVYHHTLSEKEPELEKHFFENVGIGVSPLFVVLPGSELNEI
jgi:hypothetical protein